MNAMRPRNFRGIITRETAPPIINPTSKSNGDELLNQLSILPDIEPIMVNVRTQRTLLSSIDQLTTVATIPPIANIIAALPNDDLIAKLSESSIHDSIRHYWN
jgi:hypothetical protein